MAAWLGRGSRRATAQHDDVEDRETRARSARPSTEAARDQKVEVDRADGDKEESEQETFERFDVGLELVSVFAVGQDDAGGRKAPSAGESPTCCMSNAIPITRSKASAGTFAQIGCGDETNTGRRRKRPPTMTTATAARTTNACCQPGKSLTTLCVACPPLAGVNVASNGRSARIGITAMS